VHILSSWLSLGFARAQKEIGGAWLISGGLWYRGTITGIPLRGGHPRPLLCICRAFQAGVWSGPRRWGLGLSAPEIPKHSKITCSTQPRERGVATVGRAARQTCQRNLAWGFCWRKCPRACTVHEHVFVYFVLLIERIYGSATRASASGRGKACTLQYLCTVDNSGALY